MPRDYRTHPTKDLTVKGFIMQKKTKKEPRAKIFNTMYTMFLQNSLPLDNKDWSFCFTTPFYTGSS